MTEVSAYAATPSLMRFHLDEDVSDVIAAIARGRSGLDVLASHECGMDGATDDGQLPFAIMQGRAIVTNNRDHFVALATRMELQEQSYSTMLITTHLPTRNVSLTVRALFHDHQLYPEDVAPRLVDFLPHPGSEEQR